MRLKLSPILLAALFGVAVSASCARAAHCGASAYPAQPLGPEQCCPPPVRHQVCYKTVWEDQTRTCYRPVYQTVLHECRYTVMHPVYETHVRQQRCIVNRPVYEEY